MLNLQTVDPTERERVDIGQYSGEATAICTDFICCYNVMIAIASFVFLFFFCAFAADSDGVEISFVSHPVNGQSNLLQQKLVDSDGKSNNYFDDNK